MVFTILEGGVISLSYTLYVDGVEEGEKSIISRRTFSLLVGGLGYINLTCISWVGSFTPPPTIVFVFVVLSSGFCQVLALAAHVCYCLFFVFCLF